MATVEGYPARTSVRAGHSIAFHVSAIPSGTLSLAVKKILPTGGSPAPATFTALVPTQPLVSPQPWEGFNWNPTVQFNVPTGWPSGLYELSENGNSVCDFVVRAAAPGSTSRILFQIGTHTPQAYWDKGGRSFYTSPRAERLSYDRPGGFYRDSAAFLAWLAQESIEVEFCTSHDLHEDDRLLDSYDLLLIVDHDEYWSREMREHVERFVRNRGNVAVFSGNTCFRQVRMAGARNELMSCYKFVGADPYPDNDTLSVAMASPPVCRPTPSTFGSGFTNGAGCWKDRVVMQGMAFDIRFPDHWVFNGIAGSRVASGSVGYETDAVAYVEEPEGYPRVTAEDGVSPTYTVLGTADLRHWGPAGKPGMATMGLLVRNGMVFNAASVSWQDALANDAAAQIVTRNVISRLCTRQTWSTWEHIGHANSVTAMTEHDGKLWCATQDNRLWRRFPMGANAPWTEIGHANDVRAMASSAGRLWCVTGDNKLWRRTAIESNVNWDPIGTGPAVGTMALSGTPFMLYALDTAGLLWMSPTRAPISWSPVPDMQATQEPQITCMAAYEDILVAATADARLVRTGTDFVYESQAWVRVHHCNFATALAVVDTMLFVATTENKLWWLDLRSLRAP
jgi:hypothetical protein